MGSSVAILSLATKYERKTRTAQALEKALRMYMAIIIHVADQDGLKRSKHHCPSRSPKPLNIVKPAEPAFPGVAAPT